MDDKTHLDPLVKWSGGKKDELKYMQKIEYIPSHGCTTINLHDRYYCIRNNFLEAIWPITARGKSQ